MVAPPARPKTLEVSVRLTSVRGLHRCVPLTRFVDQSRTMQYSAPVAMLRAAFREDGCDDFRSRCAFGTSSLCLRNTFIDLSDGAERKKRPLGRARSVPALARETEAPRVGESGTGVRTDVS